MVHKNQNQPSIHRSCRVIVGGLFLRESYDRILDELKVEPMNYNEALQDKDAEL